MSKYHKDYSYTIGNTPLVQLNRIGKDRDATILAKVEGRNPAFSVKCRVGANMIWQAEEQGLLKPGIEIVEPTSGNTGIALAFTGAARGYTVNLTMPETMSIERRKVLMALGAKVILTDGAKGMSGSIEKANELAHTYPDRYFMPNQFCNPANPQIHEKTTGPEIWNDTEGQIDVLVSGVGTGGTITGISRYIKTTMNKKIVSVAVEPANSPVISQHLAGEKIMPNSHKIQGIGAGFIPDNLDLSLVDMVESVQDEVAFEYARKLATEEGIMAGISSGAAIAVADRLAQREEFKGKMIVAILPDSCERYLSTDLFKGLF
ncbi:MAG: cysteine synthase A [Phycisphaerae bacterium]|nr:cysteine synthase A [Phycisphaerae bacterium]